jgi:uncharacterized protein (DUF849 family)
MKLELYEEVVSLIRACDVDVIINLTTGAGARFAPGEKIAREAGPGTTLSTPQDRVTHIVKLRPEICSLDIGSMNMGEHVFVNTPPHLRAMARTVVPLGVMPELEVFEAGHLMLARAMIEKGDLPMTSLFQICLGVSWGQPATPQAMIYMQQLLPPAANWFAFGVGRQQFPMVAMAILLGGNVRVGLEDNLYLERGVLASSNAALVEKAVAIARVLGQSVAPADQARKLLSLQSD